MSAYRYCPKCQAAIAPGDVAADDRWRERFDPCDGRVHEMVVLLDCHFCDEAYEVTWRRGGDGIDYIHGARPIEPLAFREPEEAAA